VNRPDLVRCLDTLRKGDTLVIRKLDWLGRSLRDLIEIAARLESEGIQFVPLTEDNLNTYSLPTFLLPSSNGSCSWSATPGMNGQKSLP
jgi:DNA invertase Pin-like site-specific DNA recombinase